MNNRGLFTEEKIARSFHFDIEDYFKKEDITPSIDLDGVGVHWYSILEMNTYKVTIKNCNHSHCLDDKGRVEGFIVIYYDDEKEVCCGRTRDREAVIRSSEVWLRYASKDKLYQFTFVDYDLRYFQKREQEWITQYPELKSVFRSLDNHGEGLIKYRMIHKDRVCSSSGFGDHS